MIAGNNSSADPSNEPGDGPDVEDEVAEFVVNSQGEVVAEEAATECPDKPEGGNCKLRARCGRR